VIYAERIKKRPVLLGGLSVLILGATGATGVWAVGRVNARLDRAGTLSQALLKHGEIDMLHDTLRGDVLTVLNLSRGDLHGRADIERDTGRHVARLKLLEEQLHGLDLPIVAPSIARAEPHLLVYAEMAERLVRADAHDHDWVKRRAPEFLERFTALEPELKLISTRLAHQVQIAKVDGHRTALLTRAAIALGLASALMILLTLFVIISREIIAASAKLVDARREAEAAGQAKADFLTTMSHEIRTPLNGVIGMTSLLLDTDLSVQQRNYAHTALVSGNSLLGVINDVLDFAKIDAGKIALEEIDFDLCELVETVTAMVAAPACAKGLELASFVDHDLPLRLRGDPLRIRQVLINLASNAVKFTPDGEVVVRARTGACGEAGPGVRFEVEDTGIGIDPEKRAQLFEAFAQADASTTRRYGGTGLGLAIAAKLARLMGGDIGVDSPGARGSLFWFSVPLREARVPRISSSEMRGKRVLIVDDNAVNREILIAHARAWGMVQESAASAPEALVQMRSAAAGSNPFDVAILDMQMPGMDGLELARAIHADPALSNTRLLLLSSMGDARGAALASATILDGCLTKPARQSELYDCLVGIMADATAPGDAAGDQPAPATGRGATILVAEDNVVNQQVARGVLAQLGFIADVVANGVEAVAAVAARPYAAVLMDCQMPHMDGFAATRAIRRDENGGTRIPIIAVTADVIGDVREACLAAGMDDYVSKPLDRIQLRRILTRYVASGTDDVGSPSAKASVGGAGILHKLGSLDRATPGLGQQIATLFIDDGRKRVADLGAALASNDAGRVAAIAHTLHGAAASVSATDVAVASAALEQLGRAGTLERAQELFDALNAAFDEACEALSSAGMANAA
jgi:signal transduction histidine kinase/CheY-like chemotaxis protein/HPt (histidine-containing phosphotransfer) domain-containing protein